MKAEDQFHVGIVVDDIAETQRQLTAVFGYEWCEVGTAPAEVSPAGGERVTVQSTMCYSRDEPRLELVGSVPDTIWQPAPGSGIHHLGYWSDDVEADSAALADQGCALELTGGPEGFTLFAYHRNPAGPRIEILSRMVQPMFEQYWETGKSPF